jgi:alkanesulfonate monooxygenase SsuD/methylene tetrahydromethanopterin reductase-like flavin-dependent oxidoreductase (luciferase family)
MNSQLTEEIETCQAQNRNYLLSDGFHRLVRQTNSFALLLRDQAQAERQYRRAIEEFDRLKALREQLPNEPISAETETNETTSPSCETNPIPNPQPPTPQPLAPGPWPLAPGSPAGLPQNFPPPAGFR